jgi:hypothetical protein
MGMRTQAIAGQLGVNGQLGVSFAGIIQSAPLNLRSMSLNIIGNFCFVPFRPARIRVLLPIAGR